MSLHSLVDSIYHCLPADRGMGDSSLSPKGDEEISIEMMARDLLFLLAKLGWEEIILCGHSMGGK